MGAASQRRLDYSAEREDAVLAEDVGEAAGGTGGGATTKSGHRRRRGVVVAAAVVGAAVAAEASEAGTAAARAENRMKTLCAQAADPDGASKGLTADPPLLNEK